MADEKKKDKFLQSYMDMAGEEGYVETGSRKHYGFKEKSTTQPGAIYTISAKSHIGSRIGSAKRRGAIRARGTSEQRGTEPGKKNPVAKKLKSTLAKSSHVKHSYATPHTADLQDVLAGKQTWKDYIAEIEQRKTTAPGAPEPPQSMGGEHEETKERNKIHEMARGPVEYETLLRNFEQRLQKTRPISTTVLPSAPTEILAPKKQRLLTAREQESFGEPSYAVPGPAMNRFIELATRKYLHQGSSYKDAKLQAAKDARRINRDDPVSFQRELDNLQDELSSQLPPEAMPRSGMTYEDLVGRLEKNTEARGAMGIVDWLKGDYDTQGKEIRPPPWGEAGRAISDYLRGIQQLEQEGYERRQSSDYLMSGQLEPSSENWARLPDTNKIRTELNFAMKQGNITPDEKVALERLLITGFEYEGRGYKPTFYGLNDTIQKLHSAERSGMINPGITSLMERAQIKPYVEQWKMDPAAKLWDEERKIQAEKAARSGQGLEASYEGRIPGRAEAENAIRSRALTEAGLAAKPKRKPGYQSSLEIYGPGAGADESAERVSEDLPGASITDIDEKLAGLAQIPEGIVKHEGNVYRAKQVWYDITKLMRSGLVQEKLPEMLAYQDRLGGIENRQLSAFKLAMDMYPQLQTLSSDERNSVVEHFNDLFKQKNAEMINNPEIYLKDSPNLAGNFRHYLKLIRSSMPAGDTSTERMDMAQKRKILGAYIQALRENESDYYEMRKEYTTLKNLQQDPEKMGQLEALMNTHIAEAHALANKFLNDPNATSVLNEAYNNWRIRERYAHPLIPVEPTRHIDWLAGGAQTPMGFDLNKVKENFAKDPEYISFAPVPTSTQIRTDEWDSYKPIKQLLENPIQIPLLSTKDQFINALPKELQEVYNTTPNIKALVDWNLEIRRMKGLSEQLNNVNSQLLSGEKLNPVTKKKEKLSGEEWETLFQRYQSLENEINFLENGSMQGALKRKFASLVDRPQEKEYERTLGSELRAQSPRQEMEKTVRDMLPARLSQEILPAPATSYIEDIGNTESGGVRGLGSKQAAQMSLLERQRKRDTANENRKKFLFTDRALGVTYDESKRDTDVNIRIPGMIDSLVDSIAEDNNLWPQEIKEPDGSVKKIFKHANNIPESMYPRSTTRALQSATLLNQYRDYPPNLLEQVYYNLSAARLNAPPEEEENLQNEMNIVRFIRNFHGPLITEPQLKEIKKDPVSQQFYGPPKPLMLRDPTNPQENPSVYTPQQLTFAQKQYKEAYDQAGFEFGQLGMQLKPNAFWGIGKKTLDAYASKAVPLYGLWHTFSRRPTPEPTLEQKSKNAEQLAARTRMNIQFAKDRMIGGARNAAENEDLSANREIYSRYYMKTPSSVPKEAEEIMDTIVPSEEEKAAEEFVSGLLSGPRSFGHDPLQPTRVETTIPIEDIQKGLREYRPEPTGMQKRMQPGYGPEGYTPSEAATPQPATAPTPQTTAPAERAAVTPATQGPKTEGPKMGEVGTPKAQKAKAAETANPTPAETADMSGKSSPPNARTSTGGRFSEGKMTSGTKHESQMRKLLAFAGADDFHEGSGQGYKAASGNRAHVDGMEHYMRKGAPSKFHRQSPGAQMREAIKANVVNSPTEKNNNPGMNGSINKNPGSFPGQTPGTGPQAILDKQNIMPKKLQTDGNMRGS